jgi:acyl-CoA synthetase (AMP-forming)/AMP-acid ligase II
MAGYLDDPEATAAALSPDGWLRTGDLGTLDERGYLTLVGRKSEMYIRGGYNVYPAEVERVLEGHASVGQVAIVGIPDRVLGEIGAAFVVAAAGTGPDLGELRDHVKAQLADYKAPDRLVVLDALPTTAMGKVDKRALAALASEA